MQNVWSQKWKKVLIWFSGYISFLAFALVGGYTVVKVEDEELKKTAKQTFLVVLLFAAISAALSIFNYICGFMDSYPPTAYEIYSTLSRIVSLAQIGTYAFFIIKTLVSKDEN